MVNISFPLLPKKRRPRVDRNEQPQASPVSRLRDNIWAAVEGPHDGALEKVLGRWLMEETRDKKASQDIESSGADDPRNSQDLVMEAVRAGLGTKQQIRDSFDSSRGMKRFEDGNPAPYSVLFAAITGDHPKDVDYLVQNFKIALDARCGFQRRTAIAQAVKKKRWNMVYTILESPFTRPSHYINLVDFAGDAPIHYLASFLSDGSSFADYDEMVEVVYALIQHGANIDSPDTSSLTPLHTIIFYRSLGAPVRAVQILLDAGAEVNTKDESGTFP
ncbi:hypothetical protein jhhlp_001593 [Lomentospora prolificans]|uniref:Uncharacterized protein n=1 Tax=Lomentospora prolificans TaxID=41688 RepID=A0A2N3NIN3_9PEZI|nr:hypothetical protein jhhlp_001593 [Lomentospora prolificans]